MAFTTGAILIFLQIVAISSFNIEDVGSGSGSCVGNLDENDNCDYYRKALDYSHTCKQLEDDYGVDCTGCDCTTPVQDDDDDDTTTTSTTSTTTDKPTDAPTEAPTQAKETDAPTEPSTTQELSAEVEQQVQQAKKYTEALTVDNLNENINNYEALKDISSLEQVGDISIKPGAEDAPTELSGEFKLTGISKDNFGETQKEAFRGLVGDTVGVSSDRVRIDGIQDSTRRRLRGRVLAEGDSITIKFTILVESGNPDEGTIGEEPGEEPGLSGGAIAAIIVGSILGVGAVAGIAVGLVLFFKHKQKQETVSPEGVEMTLAKSKSEVEKPGTPTTIDVRRLSGSEAGPATRKFSSSFTPTPKAKSKPIIQDTPGTPSSIAGS